MKKTVVFSFGFLLMVSLLGAQFWTLDFETASGYTTDVPEFTDTFYDYWIRTDGSDHGTGAVYNDVIGTYYFAGQDIDGEGATLPVFLDIDDINISGQTNLEFKIYLAEDQATDDLEDWDLGDYFHIYYDVDNSGSFSNLLWISNDGTTYNTAPLIDTDFDGTGDGTEITDTFVQFTVLIPATGSLLDLQIEFNLNSGDEDIAIDHLQLFEAGASTPTITLSESSLTGFSYIVGSGPSSEQSFTAEGSDLTADITITAPTNYEISETSGSGYTSPITLTQIGGTVSATTIYARLIAGLSAGDYNNEDITASSTDATSKTVTCSGTVNNLEPTNHVTSFAATADGFQKIDLSWIANDGIVVPDGYLIKASTTTTITDPVDGTAIADNTTIGEDSGAMNIAHGTNMYEWTGLNSETIYYFNIYPYTNSGTAIDYKTDGTIPTDNATTGVQPEAPDVFFSEYIEGSSNNKALEIVNNTGSTINLDNYRINQSNNGGGWQYQHYFPVAATLANGNVWVMLNADTDTLLFNHTGADEVLAYPSVVHHNGNDARGLEYTADGGANWFLIDVFGVPTEDIYWDVAGVSEAAHEHTLVRKSDVLEGNTNWALSAGTDAADSEWIVYPQDTFDYLGAHTMGGNALPLITNVVRIPAGDVTSSTTVSVSANVTDSDGTITLVELNWGTSTGSLGNRISMSNIIDDTYETDSDIPAQSDLTTVYYEIYAEDNIPESSTSAEQNYTVFDAQSTTLPYNEAFDADLGLCYTNSVSGATKYWVWDDFDINGFAYMSGYNSGETEEDWLILPAIDFDSYANETMTFDTWYNYGTDNATNYLKLYYSYDYPGLGDPSGYTWTELAFTHPGASQTWTSSGSIDLATVSGTSVYVAFKYRYEVSLYRNWEVDNLSINGDESLDAPTDLVVTVNGNDIDLNWTAVTGATGYNIYRSTEPDNFGTSVHDTSPTNSYTDTGAAIDDKYFYMVTATN